MNTKNYLFMDNDTNDFFIVEAETKDAAMRIAYFYFDDVKYIITVSDFTAETGGYDTYS